MPRLRPVPWLMVLQAAHVASEHWSSNLTTKERVKLRKLVAKSRGLPRNLSARERTELRRLVALLDVPGAGRKMLVPASGRKTRR